MFKIVNGYEDVDRNMFFKLKEGSRTRGNKAALVNCADNLTSQYGSIDEIIKGGSQMAMVDRIIRRITHHCGPPAN